ncbi:glycosyltransferase family protein [Halomonas huangheensis]|uniref:Spore protein YkvP/CgeB glycosyl transferase-like domain-containing protein n=1 Tax=Halomonas huangheensis TaxID=1178482 RepID=W1NCQ2_9GAMM|nr:glycosyltransferase [Halomonas huangheensis]ALM52824.1 hypothetical protein AR456_11435 [Halomonas huangheensis]ERL53263.1 hypothetical protein BJB45_18500 [Halomonas huangheensis]
MEKVNLEHELCDFLDELGLGGNYWLVGDNESLLQALSVRIPSEALHTGVPDTSDVLDQCSVLILSSSQSELNKEVFEQLECSDARPIIILLDDRLLPESVQNRLHAIGYKLPPVQPKQRPFYVVESIELSHKKYFDVAGYWESRYASGRNSGAGSYGRLARFKAHFLNHFVKKNKIQSVLEIGCGDGAQLSLAEYPQYTGLDISPTIIEHCSQTFAHDSSKRFHVYKPESFDPASVQSELALSLDVIYHLSNDEVYEYYLKHLFAASTKFVIIYSNASSEQGNRAGINEASGYVRFRDVLSDVEEWYPGWNLVKAVPNSYPFSAINPNNTSFADFFVFERSSDEKLAESKTADFDRFGSDKIINTLMMFDENAKGLADDVNSANKKIDVLAKEIRKLDSSYKLQDSLNQAHQTILALQEELGTERERYNELESQFINAQQQIGELEGKLRVSEAGYQDVSEQYRQLSEQHDDITARYRAANSKYRDGCQQLYALKSSHAYKAGLHVKAASGSVVDAVKLPVRLWRLRRPSRSGSNWRINLRQGLRYIKWNIVVPAATRLGIPYHRVAHLTLPQAAQRRLDQAASRSSQHNSVKARPGSTSGAEVLFTPPSAAAEEISILGWPAPSDNGKPVVLAVMDEFTEGCFGSDLRLLQPRPDNWYGLARKYPPAMVFIESAWKGNGGSWQYRVGTYNTKPGQELQQMAGWARQEKIPTVFWNKEDPVHHDKFMEAAGLADHIFTTDQNMVDSYRKRTGNKSVHALPFAAQPALHKPAPLRGRLNKSCFAGSWYGNRHAERGEAMKWLLASANKHGLDIFDRNHGTGIFPFPEEYQGGIRGSLPYLELCKEYSRYRVFLNVNSVTDSPTMFSRRVFELMACGTPVVSTYARGIAELFDSDAVWLVRTEAEAEEAIHTLLNDDDEWRRRSLAGIREVFSGHTYAHRLNSVFEIIGSDERIDTTPELLLVAHAEHRAELDQLLSFAQGQRYRNFRLLIESPVTSSSDMSAAPEKVELVTAVEQAEAVQQSEKNGYQAVGRVSSSHRYGTYYLQDLVNAMSYQPEAAGWAKACSEDAFSYDVDTRLSAAIWRPKAFQLEWLRSDDRSVSSSSLFCTDTDEFSADHSQGNCGELQDA